MKLTYILFQLFIYCKFESLLMASASAVSRETLGVPESLLTSGKFMTESNFFFFLYCRQIQKCLRAMINVMER